MFAKCIKRNMKLWDSLIRRTNVFLINLWFVYDCQLLTVKFATNFSLRKCSNSAYIDAVKCRIFDWESDSSDHKDTNDRTFDKKRHQGSPTKYWILVVFALIFQTTIRHKSKIFLFPSRSSKPFRWFSLNH